MADNTAMKNRRTEAPILISIADAVRMLFVRSLLSMIALSTTSVGWAEPSSVMQSTVIQSETRQAQQQRGQVFDSAVLPTQTSTAGSTKSRLDKAKEWGLTETEWSRYEEVMAGPRGYWSPHLDPLTALGVEARNDTERRHFAELWVRMETARTTRELAFELEHINAQQRIFPDVKPVQYSPQVRGKSTLATSGAKRILFFAYKGCIDACRAPLLNLIKIVSSDSAPVLDVYVKGFDADDTALRGWAANEQIPAQLVQSGRITLNHENGSLNRLKLTLENLPLTLLRTSDGKLTPFRG